MSKKESRKQEKENSPEKQEKKKAEGKNTAENIAEEEQPETREGDDAAQVAEDEAEKDPREENAGEETDEAGEAPAEENKDWKDKYLRLSADFDNYRKRTLKEKMDMTKNAGEELLKNLLPVMDDFERALKSMEAVPDCEPLKDGIDLIYHKFSDFLKQNGVKEIEAMELDFDTDVHEAVTKIPAPKKELKGKVVDVIEKGYYLHEKVIRFAKVVVGE